MGKSHVNRSKKKKKIPKKDLFAARNKNLKGAAMRALKEAAERRREFDATSIRSEDNPSGSLEPTRYGDWEADGKCSDF